MKFCSQCAHPVVYEIPTDDNLPRFLCKACGVIHYQNPKIVTCSLPYWQEGDALQVLLCKRAIEPRKGFWTLPGGFMENGESTREAALRETDEEAGAVVTLEQLFAVVNLPMVNQVHLFYLAKLHNLTFNPGLESLSVALFSHEDIPWEDLAFTSTRRALEAFFTDPVLALSSERCIYDIDVKRLVYPR